METPAIKRANTPEPSLPLPSYVWENIFSFLQVKQLCTLVTVCKLWHGYYDIFYNWITQFKALPTLNPLHILLDLEMGNLKEEVNKRILMCTNIQTRGFAHTNIAKKGGAFRLCFKDFYALHYSTRYTINHTKTMEEVWVAPEQLKKITYDKDYVLVITTIRDLDANKTCFSVYSWRGILSKNSDTLIRKKVLDYEMDPSALGFSVEQDRIVLIDKGNYWRIFRFSDFVECCEVSVTEDIIYRIAMQEDTVVSANFHHHSDEICVWKLENNTLSLIFTYALNNPNGTFHLDNKYLMVNYHSNIAVYNRTTLKLVRTVETEFNFFCANYSLGLIATQKIAPNGDNIIRLSDIQTGKEIYSEVVALKYQINGWDYFFEMNDLKTRSA